MFSVDRSSPRPPVPHNYLEYRHTLTLQPTAPSSAGTRKGGRFSSSSSRLADVLEEEMEAESYMTSSTIHPNHLHGHSDHLQDRPINLVGTTNYLQGYPGNLQDHPNHLQGHLSDSKGHHSHLKVHPQSHLIHPPGIPRSFKDIDVGYQPPTLKDYLPPTLFDSAPRTPSSPPTPAHLPPTLGSYLPPTLLDPPKSKDYSQHQDAFSSPKLGN